MRNSDTGKRYSKKPRVNLRRKVLSAAILAASQAAWVGPAMAGPDGGRVVGGDGSIDRDGRNTTIHQHTDRMIIDWDSYNVDADQIVTYIQPGTDSVSLNRILSNNGSEIHGQINANGHVVLVNPNGIFFGENSQVNVGGLIASGLRIDASDFMNGDFTFSAIEGTEGKVVNQGLINAATGGSVTLLGKQVRNDGLISARLGAVNEVWA
jgi:filamentous hemagglutinin family protein